MKIEIKVLDTNKTNLPADVLRLYKSAGWVQADETDTQYTAKILQNSYCCVGAFYDNNLVGFFRAISDGVSDAYLLDMFVEEAYRNRGIASAMLDKILAYLKSNDIVWVTCISTEQGQRVYEKKGSKMLGHIPYNFKL